MHRGVRNWALAAFAIGSTLFAGALLWRSSARGPRAATLDESPLRGENVRASAEVVEPASDETREATREAKSAPPRAESVNLARASATTGAVAGAVLVDDWLAQLGLEVDILPSSLAEQRVGAFALLDAVTENSDVAADGTFRVDDVAPGAQAFVLRAGGSEVATIDGVQVRAGATNRDARFNPLDLRGRLRLLDVRCVDGFGAPIESSRVHVTSSQRDLEVATDRDGHLRLVVGIDEAHWCFDRPETTTDCVEWSASQQTAVLAARVTIRFAVGPARAPESWRLRIGLEHVDAAPSDSWKGAFGEVDASGRAEISIKSAGRYRVACELVAPDGRVGRDDAGAYELELGTRDDGVERVYSLSAGTVADLVRRVGDH